MSKYGYEGVSKEQYNDLRDREAVAIASEDRDSSINRAMRRLNDEVSGAERVLAELTEVLTPVLPKYADPENKTADEEREAGVSDLGDSLLILADRVREHRDAMNRLKRKVDL